jgi:LPS export ABC transporter protein LptC
MNRARLLLTLLGLGVLVFAFVLGRGGRTPGVPRPAAAAVTWGSSYVIHDAVVRQADEQGKLRYDLSAQRVEQRNEGGTVFAFGVTLKYQPSSGGADSQADNIWTVTAGSAQLPASGSVLQLRGDVVASGIAQASRVPLTLSSESLDYDTVTTQLRTPALVRLRLGAHDLEGRGLNANIKLGTVELESQVHGRITR